LGIVDFGDSRPTLGIGLAPCVRVRVTDQIEFCWVLQTAHVGLEADLGECKTGDFRQAAVYVENESDFGQRSRNSESESEGPLGRPQTATPVHAAITPTTTVIFHPPQSASDTHVSGLGGGTQRAW
jgi:hypothetical protein